MSSIFSFRRNRAETLTEESPAEPIIGEEPTVEAIPTEVPLAAPQAARAELPPNNVTPDQALDRMLEALEKFLSLDGSNPLPEPSVAIISVNKRALAIGNRRGMERRGSFAVVELKGGRLEARVRFQSIRQFINTWT